MRNSHVDDRYGREWEGPSILVHTETFSDLMLHALHALYGYSLNRKPANVFSSQIEILASLKHSTMQNNLGGDAIREILWF